MEESQSSTATLVEDVQNGEEQRSSLRLDKYPSVFLLEAHLDAHKIRGLERILRRAGAFLTYDIREAHLVLGSIEKERRARFELNRAGLRFTELPRKRSSSPTSSTSENPLKVVKRKRAQDSGSIQPSKSSVGGTESTTNPSGATGTSGGASKPLSQLSTSSVTTSQASGSANTVDSQDTQTHSIDWTGVLKVVNLRWLELSAKSGRAEPIEPYVVLEVRVGDGGVEKADKKQNRVRPGQFQKENTSPTRREHSGTRSTAAILERAQADPKPTLPAFLRRDRAKDEATKEFTGRSFAPSGKPQHQSNRPTHLLHETTSEHEDADTRPLPPMPRWVTDNLVYACQRPTPAESPNDAFIALLQKIKHARLLMADEIGVRAYSTSIAALAAYPHRLTSPREILALPGCDSKIAALFSEYRREGTIRAATDIDNDAVLRILGLFYEIWGVGATTAREFYYQNHWQDLDDIVIHGWKSLNRVQQIGLKYYDDFLLRIPRSEVEAIARTVHDHAKRITDNDLQCVIVGGYRRGKASSGDVDIILSHPESSVTLGFIDDIVDALEESGEITHTLTKALTNTRRDQQPLDLRPGGGGHGFDTLDKALVVWQDPVWPSKDQDIVANEAENNAEVALAEKEGREPSLVKLKNPNPHRRVDIIISPWKTVGCAVAGWTSGTTFQRDLRRYAKKVKNWKFDSSGVRDRTTGKWIDLEQWRDPKTRCTTWQEAEKRVFINMGLEYYEPWERCTG